MEDLDLATAVDAQAICVRELKAAKVDKAVVDAEVAKLLELKAKLKESTKSNGDMARQGGSDTTASAKESQGGGYTLKCPKGTRDFHPKQMAIRLDFDIAGAYDAMLPEAECIKIVDEILSALRLGTFSIKINHRRLLDSMLAAAGCAEDKFKSICASVDKLDKASWLDVKAELMKERGLDEETVDSMEPMIMLRENKPELLCDAVIDELLQVLSETAKRRLAPPESDGQKKGKVKAAEKKIDGVVKNAQGALNDLKLLLEYLRFLGVADRVRFEPSLARGLDYYTGLIYEAVICDFASSSEAAGADSLTAEQESQLGVGSVAGGGRYDYLVGMFMSAGAGGKAPLVPCVGVSIGIERLFAIMESKAVVEGERVRTTETEVFVGSAHKKLTLRRLEIARVLWDAGIKAEMPYKKDPRLLDQYQYCEDKQIPFAVILGDSELALGQCKLRDVAARLDTDVDLSELVDKIKGALELRNKKDA